MKKQSLTTSQERKMKFAEAGILIALVLALTIFVGTRLSSPESEEVAAATTEITSALDSTSAAESAQPSIEPAADNAVIAEIEPVEEAVEAAPQPQFAAAVTYAEAEQAFFAGQYTDAAAMFSRYTRDHESNAWGFYMLGLSEFKAGDNEAAEEAYLQALDLKPEHLKSLVNYSRVLIALDRNVEAETQIQLALAVSPDNPDAHRVLGRIQHNLGLLDEAAASYRTVLASQGEDAWALNNLGLIYIEQENFADAVGPLAKASLIRSEEACIQNNLGVALERTGQYLAAAEAFALALEVDPNYAKAGESLARVEGLQQDENLVPVDLAALAAGFTIAPVVTTAMAMEVDMEVASSTEPATK